MKLQDALLFYRTQYEIILRNLNHTAQYLIIKQNIVLQYTKQVSIMQYEIIRRNIIFMNYGTQYQIIRRNIALQDAI